jgi:DNA-binding MarR family transcriptional regulator
MAHRIIIMPEHEDRESERRHAEALDRAVERLSQVGSRLFRQAKASMMRQLQVPEEFRELGDAQMFVLHALGKGKHLSSELARLHSVTSPTMSRIVDGLVEKGYIQRIPDAEDRRCVFLQLTDGGREMGKYMEEQVRISMKQMLSSLTEEQLNDISRAYGHIARLLASTAEAHETTQQGKQSVGVEEAAPSNQAGSDHIIRQMTTL